MQNTQGAIRSWFHQPYQRTMSDGDLLEAYHRQHPSKVFLRSLPVGSTVLDIGAGDGGLSVFKSWPSPGRQDLRLYAYALDKGERFDAYDGYELGDWNKQRPDFGGMKFDAIVCANFIEHIDSPASLIDWATQSLQPCGRIYLEWPTDDSQWCPTLPQLADIGFGCIIGNYFDDPTHRHKMPTTSLVHRRLRRNSAELESSGTIRMPLLADELLGHFRDTGDLVSLQLAFWLRTGSLQFAIATLDASTPGRLIKRMRNRLKRPSDYAAFADAMRARKPD